jgi:molybdopterin-guanine dinucleotide biosynthesis protein A
MGCSATHRKQTINYYNQSVPTTIVIQAGGESRRMGQDKALLSFLGQPLIQRVIDRVVGLADELLVTTNRPADYQFLGLPLIPDILPGRGALGGLCTALQAASHDCVMVLACDMPFVNPFLLALERDLLLAGDVDGVMPRTAAGLEPFHAVYRRATCLLPAQEALKAGQWRADAWFERVKFRYVEIDEILQVDPQLLSFKNVNTPQEWQAAIELAKRIDILSESDAC